MAEYTLRGTWTEVYEVVITADSLEEAEDTMVDMWNDGQLLSNNGEWNVEVI